MTPPTILIATPVFPPSVGGIERTAGALAHNLGGAEIHVVAGEPKMSDVGIDVRSVQVAWSRNDPPGGRRATIELNRVAVRTGLRLRPQVVLAVHIRAMPAARALSRLIGSRTLLIVHAKEMSEQPKLARAAIRWADLIVAVSRHARDLALEAGAEPSRLRIIHPGVNLPPEVPALQRDPDAPPMVVTVSRMADEHKGHRQALHALARLRETVPTVHWVMVGDGPLRERLQREAIALGVDRAVSFTGTVSDAERTRRLSAADVFCLLSQPPQPGVGGEGFGIVFTEAGAHGLPVVGGRVPGVEDAVDDGHSGFLVAPDDPAAAAAALTRLLTEPSLAASMGAAGRARAESLTWKRVGDRYRQAIDEMLNGPRRQVPRGSQGWALDLARGPAAP